MKGIILAGGKATRLFPVTKVTCKQLLPVFDKPLIYYPLSVLMLAGVRDILIITTPQDVSKFEHLFKDGSQYGLTISYKVQESPRGLADAFIVGEEFIGDDSVCMILGDNIFHGRGLSKILEKAGSSKDGATIFGYYVNDPRSFGVIEFDKSGNVISLEEKPENPKSNYIATGLYFFDNRVSAIAKIVKPSARGEIEIISVINEYLKMGKLTVERLGRGFIWIDTGSHESLADATNYVKIIEERQGLKIGCIEEIAYTKGYINKSQLEGLAEELVGSGYGRYLLNVLKF
jgi:glucose-1-phosphate thymidylyltransferase